MIYIAFLRGVNVSGKNLLNMKSLVEILIKEKYQNVQTYIQSGNIVFEFKNIQTSELERNIEGIIKSNFNIITNAIIKAKKELENINSSNPFANDKKIDKSKLHVTLLSKETDKKLIPSLDNLKGADEMYSVIGTEVYLCCPNGYGKTKLNNINIEKKLNTIATTRNWNTIQNLLFIANSI